MNSPLIRTAGCFLITLVLLASCRGGVGTSRKAKNGASGKIVSSTTGSHAASAPTGTAAEYNGITHFKER